MSISKFKYQDASKIVVEDVLNYRGESCGKLRVIHYVDGFIEDIIEFYKADQAYSLRKFGVKKSLIVKGKEFLN